MEIICGNENESVKSARVTQVHPRRDYALLQICSCADVIGRRCCSSDTGPVDDFVKPQGRSIAGDFRLRRRPRGTTLHARSDLPITETSVANGTSGSYALRVHYTWPKLVIAIVPSLIQLTIAVRMSMFQLYKRFPFFFIYTAFHVLADSYVLYTSWIDDWTYFYAFWSVQFVDIFLSLAVIQELYEHAFEPFDTLRKLMMLIFRWSALILCGITVIAASLAPGVNEAKFMMAILILHRSAGFVMTGLLALLFALSAFFGVKWQKLPFSIGMGMTVVSALTTVGLAIRTQYGGMFHSVYALIAPLSYNLGCGIWIYGAFAKAHSVSGIGGSREQLATWNQALEEIADR